MHGWAETLKDSIEGRSQGNGKELQHNGSRHISPELTSSKDTSRSTVQHKSIAPKHNA